MYYIEDAETESRLFVPPGLEATATGIGPVLPATSHRPAWNREMLIAALRKMVVDHGGPVTMWHFCRELPTTPATIDRHVRGGWRGLLEEAGVPAVPRSSGKLLTDDELLADYDRLRTEYGRPPTAGELARFGIACYTTYHHRLGPKRERETRWATWRAASAAHPQ